jgi:hypothetical protein
LTAWPADCLELGRAAELATTTGRPGAGRINGESKMAENERIIARIRKLLAFDGDNATEGEIENAMRLAQELMERHAIDAAELADRPADDRPAEPERDRRSSTIGARVSTWESTLAWAVVQAVPGVNHYSSTEFKRSFGTGRSRRQATIVWYGPADLVEVAAELYESTRLTIATMAAGVYSGVYRGQGRSYCEGFASALYAKARKQRQAGEHAEKLGAIVLASEAANKKWLATTHNIKLRTVSRGGGGAHYGDAYGEGRKDGERHGFNPGRPSGKLSGGRAALPS